MRKNENPLDTFQSEAPEVQQAYAQVIQSLIAVEGMEPKVKQLIYIGMKIVAADENAIKYHVPMAKLAGASREEIKTTVLLSITVCGLSAISKYLKLALDEYDRS